MQTVLDERRRRAAYRATHRGTKEMDWLLGRYAQAHLAGMSDDELEQFERLIQQPDPTLQAQIMAASSPDDGPDATSAEDEFGSLIRRIRAHHGIGETAS